MKQLQRRLQSLITKISLVRQDIDRLSKLEESYVRERNQIIDLIESGEPDSKPAKPVTITLKLASY